MGEYKLSWFYYAGRVLVRGILFCFTRWRVEYSENLPAEGAYLIVSNHLSIADPPIIAVSIKRKMMFMAKDELFHPAVVGYFIRRFGGFPVNRREIDRSALREANRILASGLSVAMFPEGSRSRDKKLKQGLPGSALIAAHARVPILPVALTGTREIAGIKWIFRRPEIVVKVGHPFQLPPMNNNITTKEYLTESTDCIMHQIAALLPPQYRGYYADGEEHEN